MKINGLTIIANIYHGENRSDNDLIILSNIKITERIRKEIKRMNGEK